MKIKELKEKAVRVEAPKCNRKLSIIALIIFMALCIGFVFIMASLFSCSSQPKPTILEDAKTKEKIEANSIYKVKGEKSNDGYKIVLGTDGYLYFGSTSFTQFSKYEIIDYVIDCRDTHYDFLYLANGKYIMNIETRIMYERV